MVTFLIWMIVFVRTTKIPYMIYDFYTTCT